MKEERLLMDGWYCLPLLKYLCYNFFCCFWSNLNSTKPFYRCQSLFWFQTCFSCTYLRNTLWQSWAFSTKREKPQLYSGQVLLRHHNTKNPVFPWHLGAGYVWFITTALSNLKNYPLFFHNMILFSLSFNKFCLNFVLGVYLVYFLQWLFCAPLWNMMSLFHAFNDLI